VSVLAAGIAMAAVAAGLLAVLVVYAAGAVLSGWPVSGWPLLSMPAAVAMSRRWRCRGVVAGAGAVVSLVAAGLAAVAGRARGSGVSCRNTALPGKTVHYSQ
jgi:hypothetical protein